MSAANPTPYLEAKAVSDAAWTAFRTARIAADAAWAAFRTARDATDAASITYRAACATNAAYHAARASASVLK